MFSVINRSTMKIIKQILKIDILLLISFSVLISQTKRDPRSVALAGTYTTIADGIFSIGYNPSLLAYQQEKPFMLQLGGFDFGVVGNYISLSNLYSLSGDTLSNNEKDLLYDNFKDNGLTFFPDFHMPYPGLNFSSGNMAFTSNMLLMSDIRIPSGLLRLLLYGNANDPELDLTLNYEILGVNEIGFSFAVPFDQFAVGMTLKYLQGLFYFGIDPDSSYANLVTTDEAVYGEGAYFIRQGFGGSGFGIDLGLSTQEINGWRAGFSIINAIGSISWNKPSMVKDILAGSDNKYGNEDDLWHMTWGGEILDDSSAVLYTYSIDSLSTSSLTSDSLFSSEERIVKDLDKDGNLNEFTTDYPALFRIGVSRRFPELVIASDLVTGFENRFYARKKWKWSLAVESTRFPSVPLRIGYCYGGSDFKELSMGFGIHKGPIIFDVGMAFRNGIWIHTMKGINLSMGVTITSFGGRKDENQDLETEGGPLPLPADQNKSEEKDLNKPGSLPSE